MSRPAARLPLAVVVPLLGGLLAVIPAVTHDAVEVRRAAFAASLVLLGLGALGVLVHVRHWLSTAERAQENLLAKVDSWGALVGFLEGQQPTSVAGPRRRWRLVRGAHAARQHAGPVSAVSVGVAVTVALIAGAGHDGQPGAPEAAPDRPVQRVPQSTAPPSTPVVSPTPSTVAPPARRPSPRPATRPPVTVTRTVTATVTAPATGEPRSVPLLGLLSAPADPPPAEAPTAAAATPTSSTPPTLIAVAVGDG